MQNRVLDKIFEIENEIAIWQNDTKNVSLFQGLGGLPVFYFLLYTLTKKEGYRDKVHSALENIVEILNNDDFSLTYCDGLIGIGYMFNFIKNKNILKEEFNLELEESLDFIDECILESSLENTNSIDDLDFLHGTFGGAFYLIERLNTKHTPEFGKSVIKLFEKLAEIVIKECEETDKLQHLTKDDQLIKRVNCGLAHGHIAYILLFTKFLEKFKHNEIVFTALKKSVSSVIRFEDLSEDNLSAYPSIAVNKSLAKYNISLGWCYGDQTISLSFYKAAKILKDNELNDRASNLALRNLDRNTVEKMFSFPFYDAGFCHGLSSIAYLHKKWFTISRDKRFYDLYEKMIKDILDFGSNERGIAGFQKFKGNGTFEDSFGLLDGAMGIGIILIDYLLEEKENEWDSLFLLN